MLTWLQFRETPHKRFRQKTAENPDAFKKNKRASTLTIYCSIDSNSCVYITPLFPLVTV